MWHPCSRSISWRNVSFMEDCKALVGLWLDAAVILLIYICCTTNGGYKRLQLCPFQTLCFRAQLQMMRKLCVKRGFCGRQSVWVLRGLRGSASLKSCRVILVIRTDYILCAFCVSVSCTHPLCRQTHTLLTIRSDSLCYVIAASLSQKALCLFHWQQQWFCFTVFSSSRLETDKHKTFSLNILEEKLLSYPLEARSHHVFHSHLRAPSCKEFKSSKWTLFGAKCSIITLLLLSAQSLW